MRLSREQVERIERLLPKQRGTVAIDHRTVLNAMLYVAVIGRTRRGLPIMDGRWHTVS
jgi:transposase